DHRTCWRGDQLLTVEARCDPDDVVSLPCTRRSAGVHQRTILAVDGRGCAIRRCCAPSTAGPPVVGCRRSRFAPVCSRECSTMRKTFCTGSSRGGTTRALSAEMSSRGGTTRKCRAEGTVTSFILSEAKDLFLKARSFS